MLLTATALGAGEPRHTEFYVATYGSDLEDGTEKRPFATLQRARDAIRKLKHADALIGPVTVRIRGGTYPHTETFALCKEDSGTAASPITYRAYDDEDVRLVGGRRIEASWFTPVKDAAILDRLPNDVRGKVLQADLKSHGITDYGELHGLGGGIVLFLDGKRLPVARWPNEGWALGRRGQPAGRDDAGELKVDDPGTGCKTLVFRFDGEPPNRWRDLQRVWLTGYFWEEYFVHSWRAEEIDFDKRVITFGHGLPEHVKGDWRRFCATNAMEELDRPGEWFLDRDEGVLYLLPPDGFGETPLTASMMTSTMISLTDVSHVTIRGLTLEATRGLAVSIGGGTHCRIVGCTIRHAKYAVTLGGGTNHGVVGCDIYDLGAMGIRATGGDRKTLTPAGHEIVNNHIHHYSRVHKNWQPGVKVQGVGIRVAHNDIHDAPQYAISYEGNDHRFEFNNLHHLCQEQSDVGVIGCGTNWTYRGNVIRHNFIHHIPKRPYPGVCGVYLDNCASSAEVVGNVFYKMIKPVMIGGGRDNIVVNNVFVECEVPVCMDNRGLRWRTRWGHFRPGGPMYKPLKELQHDKPPWSTKYPKLARILEEYPQAPLGNVVKRNVSVRSGWRDPEAECRKTFKSHIDRRYVTLADNYVTDEDPGFLDAANMDFRLRDDAIVYKKIPGFAKIPFDRIGLYEDACRASRPGEGD